MPPIPHASRGGGPQPIRIKIKFPLPRGPGVIHAKELFSHPQERGKGLPGERKICPDSFRAPKFSVWRKNIQTKKIPHQFCRKAFLYKFCAAHISGFRWESHPPTPTLLLAHWQRSPHPSPAATRRGCVHPILPLRAYPAQGLPWRPLTTRGVPKRRGEGCCGSFVARKLWQPPNAHIHPSPSPATPGALQCTRKREGEGEAEGEASAAHQNLCTEKRGGIRRPLRRRTLPPPPAGTVSVASSSRTGAGPTIRSSQKPPTLKKHAIKKELRVEGIKNRTTQHEQVSRKMMSILKWKIGPFPPSYPVTKK